MYGIGNRKFEYLQTLIANATLSLNETFHNVKSHGIGFRIEVSLRPHFDDPIRYSGHGNDLLLIACMALQELFGSKFTVRLMTFPTRSIQTEAMKLLTEATSMVHYRKDIQFSQVYANEKVIEWLRSHLSILLITIGICPGYSIKYINQWLNDKDRFDPHNKVMKVKPNVESDSLSFIRHRMLHSFESHLKHLKFSENAVLHLRAFLDEAPNIFKRIRQNLRLCWQHSRSRLSRSNRPNPIQRKIADNIGRVIARNVGCHGGENFSRQKTFLLDRTALPTANNGDHTTALYKQIN